MYFYDSFFPRLVVRETCVSIAASKWEEQEFLSGADLDVLEHNYTS